MSKSMNTAEHNAANHQQTFRSSASSKYRDSILVLNAGSSSIKFAVYEQGDSLLLKFKGAITNIGSSDTCFQVSNGHGDQLANQLLELTNRKDIINFLIHWIETHGSFGTIKAVGHRVVQGMYHSAPERVSKSLLADLQKMSPYAPDHLPREIEIMEAICWRHPSLTQIACFDTAFHRTLPRVAKLLPIPRRFTDNGVQRYGFHGLSYSYLIQELEQLGDTAATKGRVILAHLGNGASMAAVLDGKSIDTSMSFSPTGGLPMSTRSGDLDPGIICYLMQSSRMTHEQLRHIVNYESGLLGISETSSDMRELLAQEQHDSRSAEAIALFCYQAKKMIGAYAAALGGLDTLVFSGGIGENAPSIRARICEGLGFLGIEIDADSNARTADLISTQASKTRVRVIHTSEELMIAKSVSEMMRERRSQPRTEIREEYL